MSQNSRGYKGKSVIANDRRIMDLPENIGNRKTFEEIRIPPDDVGNLIEHDPIATFIHDGLGNSLDDEPAHLKSGILTHLLGKKERFISRKPARDTYIRENINQKRVIVRKEDTKTRDDLQNNRGDDYMAGLIKEFSHLLAKRSGLPFSFSMTPVDDSCIDEIIERQNLVAIKLLIEEILKSTAISASVSLSQYQSNSHRFGVFFINPRERDPTKNKELISALRQVVKLHAAKFPPGHVNVLLVLANAQSVIEGHLCKIGAKKIEF